MRQKIIRYILALDDTTLLALYAACWTVALFRTSNEQVALSALGCVLATVAATVVLVLWIHRSPFRLGWRLRDLWLLIVVALAVAAAHRSAIPHVARLELSQTLQLAALFLTAAHLTLRRPQPLFATTVLLLGGSTALVWHWRQPLFPTLDPVRLAEISALVFLALLPWFAIRPLRVTRRWYGWAVLGATVAVAGVDALGGTASHGAWLESLYGAFPGETRQTIGWIVWRSWLLGCGPGHYEWLFRATMPEEFAGQGAALPGAVLVLVERGVVGLAAMLAFGAAMLWRFRPGSWALAHGEVLTMATPLRWAAGYAFLLYLVTPALRSPFGQIVLWSLFGMMRAWSSSQSPAAVALVSERPDRAHVRSAAVEPSWRWQHVYLLVGTLLAGIGLSVFHLRPWIATRWRHRPAGMARHDAAYLERVERALWWWPCDPRTQELVAIHHRAKSNAGQSLTTAELDAVTRAYERMVRTNPYDPLGHSILAHWWKLRGDPTRATDVARQGLVYCPASFELQYQLAGYYRDLGNLELARTAFLEARKLRPRYRPILLNLALLELRLGNPRQAQRYLQLAQQLGLDDASVNALLEAARTGQVDHVLDRVENDDGATTPPPVPPVPKKP